MAQEAKEVQMPHPMSSQKALKVILLVCVPIVVALLVLSGKKLDGMFSQPVQSQASATTTTVLYEDEAQKIWIRSDGQVWDAEVLGEGFASNQLRYIPIRRINGGPAITLVVPATEMFSVGEKIRVRSELVAGGLPGPGEYLFVLAE